MDRKRTFNRGRSLRSCCLADVTDTSVLQLPLLCWRCWRDWYLSWYWEDGEKVWSLRLITGTLLLWGPLSLWAILAPMAVLTAPETSAPEISSLLSLLVTALLTISTPTLALLSLMETLLALLALLSILMKDNIWLRAVPPLMTRLYTFIAES